MPQEESAENTGAAVDTTDVAVDQTADVEQTQSALKRKRSRSPTPPKTTPPVREPSEEGEEADDAPPLPDEPLPEDEPSAPPLPQEPAPQDDWVWQRDQYGRDYFVNTRTGVSQWENPRLPQADKVAETLYNAYDDPTPQTAKARSANYKGYLPEIHGSWDPNADYANETEANEGSTAGAGPALNEEDIGKYDDVYAQTGTFNARTGQFQTADKSVERHNDENKSRRQQEAFYDVDKAANAHEGLSLKEQRRQWNYSKGEIQAFKKKKEERKKRKIHEQFGSASG